MSYVADINALIKAKVASTPRLVCYGQNVVAGSSLGGLTRGLTAGPEGMVVNTANSENTLVGAGFGMMLQGVNCIYFMKQLDFLLLGMDHLVNTYNVVRMRQPNASFTIVATVVDSGFEGPQSCLNGLGDFCSIANITGYAITNAHDAEWIISNQLISPGFRIIGVSQRLYGSEMLRFDQAGLASTPGIFCYAKGANATVAAFNFSLPQALEIIETLKEKRLGASLFGISAQNPESFDEIIEDAKQTKRLVVVDDGRSVNRSSDRLISEAIALGIDVVEERRKFSIEQLYPNQDLLSVDKSKLVSMFADN